MKYNIFKVKDLDKWKAWSKTLITREKEVLETLREEKITRETAELFKLGHEYFIVYSTEGENLTPSDKQLNHEHRRAKKESLEKLKGEILFDFKS